MQLRGWVHVAFAVSMFACTAGSAKPAERERPPEVEDWAARSSEGLVTAEVVPQYDAMYVPAGSFASQQLNVLIRLSAAEDEGAIERPALDLTLVLDRSGSMVGDKLEYAKQASIDLLARLDPRDRVTLITYDDRVSTHAFRRAADPFAVTEMRRALLDVSSGGGTALGPALFYALDMVEQQDGGRRLVHVLLLSDGRATTGEQRPEVIGARVAKEYVRGTTVSTLGVGADYNEDLMALLADQGGGRYHFIEGAAQIPTVLANEFGALTSAVAADLSVEFTANPWISMDEVHGYVSETQARQTAIRVGYLGSGQSREILAQLNISRMALRGQPGEQLELGTFTVRYRPVDSAAGDDAPMIELQLPARITLAGAAEQVAWSEHGDVTVRVAELEAAASLVAASQAVERGDFGRADRIFDEAADALGDRLHAATDDAERRKLQAEADKLAQARSSLVKAKESGEGRKLMVKKYKSDAIKLGKGDSALGEL